MDFFAEQTPDYIKISFKGTAIMSNQTQELRYRADLEKAKADLLKVTGTLLENHKIEVSRN